MLPTGSMNPIPTYMLGTTALKDEYDKYKKLYDYYDNHYNIVHHRILGFEQFIKERPWFLRWIYYGSANLSRWREECIADICATEICLTRMEEIQKAMEEQ